MKLLPEINGPLLATLVSRVTTSMCGIGFEHAAGKSALPTHWWRMARLPIDGPRPIEVLLLSDETSCRALAAGMFGVEAQQIEEALIEDAFRELLNMAAGQIKSVVVPEQPLGLPRIIREEELTPEVRHLLFDGLLLRSAGKQQLYIAVFGTSPD